MKRFLSIIIVLAFIGTLFGQDNEAVSMVSYEQSWLDSNGTIALKNNTDTRISNVSMRIVYFDMNDTQLDYADYTVRVDIAPGMVKKTSIPAYESSRHYHYYKTPGSAGNTKFKISFALLGYNGATSGSSEEIQHSDSEYLMGPNSLDDMDVSPDYALRNNRSSADDAALLVLIMIAVFFVFSSGLFVIVAVLAYKKNRNVIGWVLLAMLTTPILSILLLLLVGTDRNVQQVSSSNKAEGSYSKE